MDSHHNKWFLHQEACKDQPLLCPFSIKEAGTVTQVKWFFGTNLPPCLLTFWIKLLSVQLLLSHVQLFVTSWRVARQASVSITNSWSLLKLMPIESVMPSNHLILCRPLLLLPSIFPSIRVFSNESVLHIKWPKYWSFSFNISPSNEYSQLISLRMNWLDLLGVQGTLKSLLQHHMLSCFSCVQFFAASWTVIHQAPLSMGFSRQEHWSRLPFPTPGYLPIPETEPTSLTSPALAGGFFYHWHHLGSPQVAILHPNNLSLYLVACPVVSNLSLMHARQVTSSCRTLWDPMDCSLPGSLCPWDSLGKNTGVSGHASSRGSSQPRGRICISCNSCITGWFFISEPPGKPLEPGLGNKTR